MRGRLIFSFMAELYRQDTSIDPYSNDVIDSGYDHDFKEFIPIDQNDDGIGERIRTEHPPIRISCQVEPKTFEELRMLASGNSPRSHVDLIFHFKELSKLDLIHPLTGDALIHPGDRLSSIYDKTGKLVQKIRTPPGLYVTESRPIGFGLNITRPQRNLLLVSFSDRQVGARRSR